ncbi:hypothetical protein AWR27_17590 [Spirosoma montaniterrae]|uniref:SusC/RagA family TonB-linked outer membrane protein n=2 Tax=Spirosoma montaniterrae TaxID=1178516 RepID=A0A1P9X016_9BACT|nr:hypothetical protein AWR27_17590 [Spirosoma montaniterrae]
MKVSVIQLVIAIWCTGITTAYPQKNQGLLNRRVTLRVERIHLEAALEQLSRQADVRFSYNTRLIPVGRPVSIQATNEPLGQVLDRLLTPLNLYYSAYSRQIVVKPRDPGMGLIENSPVPSFTTTNNVALTISGTVTGENGDGLPGVNILLKGTTIGTATNAQGRYSLTIPNSEGTLIFSYIGYATQEVAINSQTSLNVQLVPTNQALNEVVVVGYGTQRKADVTGATATITSKDFNTGVINNPLQAVQGRVAGLNIFTNNSDPTNNRPVIRLRGIASLTASAEPLIVIDGVLGASLNAVAPEDIEKFDVLKDASASAIYGSRGANGVIIITTKRGRSGRTAIDYNTYIGFDSPYKLPNVLSPDEYVAKYNELNPGNPNTSTARTDWFKTITRTAVSMSHNLGVSGGSSTFNYRGSVAYLKQPGIALNSGLDRLNTRLNLTQRGLNDRLDVQLNLSANQYNKQFVDYAAFTSAVGYFPTEPVYNADGSLNAPPISFNNVTPYKALTVPTNQGRETQLLGNLKVILEVLPGLKAGVNTSYSVYNNTYGYFRPKTFFAINGQTNTQVSYGRQSSDEVSDRLVEYTLAYNKTAGSHTIGALVGYTYQQLTTEGFGLQAQDFPDQFSFNNLGSANQTLTKNDIYSYKSESKLDGLLARVNYSYRDKYLLTANFRRDGSSRFGNNNRYGYFPSVSVGWNLTNEPFLQNNRLISNLKLRVGYGVTGNQNGISDYASRLLYGASGNYASPTTDPNNPIQFKTAYFFSQNANPNLKWETSATTNIGVDFGLLNNRLTGAIELYNKNTRNLLFNYSVNPGDRYGDGLTYITNSFLANIGTMNNRGVELSLDFAAIDKSDFTWRTSFNMAHNVNKIVRLSGDGLTFPADGIRYGVIYGGTNGYGPYAVLKEGLPVGTFYAPKEVGLNDKGQPLYERFDAQGNTLAPTTDPGQATKQNIGNAQPKVTLGWTNAFTYKNFDLTVFFRSSLGQKVYNAGRMVFDNPTTFRAGDLHPTNVYRSAFEGDNANLKVAGAVSSRYVESGSFVRLDNLNLGYTLRLQKTWIRSVRFYAAGQNLLLITKYSGLDPEVRAGTTTNTYGSPSNASDNLAFGLDDFFFYPRARTVSVGLNASF